jgi:transmembrane 9 superfamily protein 3
VLAPRHAASLAHPTFDRTIVGCINARHLQLVPLFDGPVGPFHSPFEQYPSTALPLCRPATTLAPETRLGGASEIFSPVLKNSNLPMRFGEEVKDEKVCSMKLDTAGATLLAYAVSNHYWAQYFLDDLPVFGMVGEVVSTEEDVRSVESHRERPHEIAESSFVFTHRAFSVGYTRAGAIVEFNLTTDNPQPIEAGKAYTLTYSVEWVLSSMEPSGKWHRYASTSSSFLESNVRWFAIFNSFFVVLFLVSLVAVILVRTLRADYSRYLREDEEEGGSLDKGLGEDSGWKQIHGDVFRRPANLPLYASLIGTGQQLLMLAVLVLSAAMASTMHVGQGAVLMSIVLGYATTSFFAGFSSGRFYRSFFAPEPSPAWIRTMLLTATVFPAAVLGTVVVQNAAVSMNGGNNAIPFVSIAKMAAIWALISLPLNIVGTIAGRRCTGDAQAGLGVRVNPIPRPIPSRPWYTSSLCLALLSGFLPFVSIFIETYFVFVSFAGHRYYFLYGFGGIVLTVLTLVVSCVAIVSTYYLLNAEDHKWHWHAWGSGASAGAYVFAYSAYYFFFRTQMTGALQTTLYFVYAALGSTALGLMTGAVAVAAASRFVATIFSAVKAD